jgi:hypothetical protein
MTDFMEMIFGFGHYAEPPDSVPLHLLGLAVMPATRAEVRAAFRAKLFFTHPDLNPEGPREALLDTVADLVWARDVLLHKIPETPLGGVTGGDCARVRSWEPSRCKVCDSKRLAPWDGKPYRVAWSWGRWSGYCLACRRDAENERQRKRRRARRANRVCACGITFTPTRSDGRYCSNACRQAAYRHRRATS